MRNLGLALIPVVAAWVGWVAGRGALRASHVHVWEPRAVTHWEHAGRDAEKYGTMPWSTLLEVCACGARRETEWQGELQLSDFMVSPAKSVDEFLSHLK